MGNTFCRMTSLLMAMLCLFSCMNVFALDENLYSVEFYWDKAGEYAENGYKAYSVEYGAQLKKPIDPERENEVFVGWKDWDTNEFVDVSAQYMLSLIHI